MRNLVDRTGRKPREYRRSHATPSSTSRKFKDDDGTLAGISLSKIACFVSTIVGSRACERNVFKNFVHQHANALIGCGLMVLNLPIILAPRNNMWCTTMDKAIIWDSHRGAFQLRTDESINLTILPWASKMLVHACWICQWILSQWLTWSTRTLNYWATAHVFGSVIMAMRKEDLWSQSLQFTECGDVLLFYPNYHPSKEGVFSHFKKWAAVWGRPYGNPEKIPPNPAWNMKAVYTFFVR